jgi:hypothetical protein
MAKKESGSTISDGPTGFSLEAPKSVARMLRFGVALQVCLSDARVLQIQLIEVFSERCLQRGERGLLAALKVRYAQTDHTPDAVRAKHAGCHATGAARW